MLSRTKLNQRIGLLFLIYYGDVLVRKYVSTIFVCLGFNYLANKYRPLTINVATYDQSPFSERDTNHNAIRNWDMEL